MKSPLSFCDLLLKKSFEFSLFFWYHLLLLPPENVGGCVGLGGVGATVPAVVVVVEGGEVLDVGVLIGLRKR